MKRLAILSLCAAGLGLGAPAWAGPSFTVTGVSVVGDDVTITGPIGPAETTAGPITLATSIGTLTAWCVDIYHDVYVGGGQNLHYSIGTVTTDGAATPKPLTAAQTRTVGQLAEYGQSLIGTASGTNDNLAAVQLAIWQTEYSGFGYTGASGASVANALSSSASFSFADTGLIALDDTQTFVTADPKAAALPEPAAVVLLAFGASILAMIRRRAA